MGHRAVRGDVLKIVFGNQFTETVIAIGEEEKPGLEYACIGKEEGEKFDYLDTYIRVVRIISMSTEEQNQRWIPKVTDFFQLPEDRKSSQYEEVKFGIVNDVTEWKMSELKWEKRKEIEAENGISEKILGYNTIGPRNYQNPKSTIDMEIKAYRKIRRNPYGARLDYLNEKTHDIITIYIGEQGIEDKKGVHVLGWSTTFQQILSCDKEGRTHLSRNNGDISDGIKLESLLHNNKGEFECNGIIYKLQLRRVYGFDDYIHGVTYEDEYDVHDDAEIIDSFLRRVLESKRRQGEMTSIVYSIQEEQRKIMYRPLERSMIIQGCAGSGKTMILMHRISALLENATQLHANNVLILTPNEIFTRSLDSLSGTLNISKVERMPIDEFYTKLVQNYLPDEIFETWNDETELYSVDVLKKAYSQEMFECLLNIENECIRVARNDIDDEFQKLEPILKRNKIIRTRYKESFENYRIDMKRTIDKLSSIIGDMNDGVRETEKKIENDQKRVEESKLTASNAEEKILGLMLEMLHKVENRKNECVRLNNELTIECEQLERTLQKSQKARSRKGFIDTDGNVNLVDLALSGDSDLKKIAREYQNTKNEIALLESEKSRLNPNDIKSQIEVEKKILQKKEELYDLYEKVPKTSDALSIVKETEIQQELEQKQREIIQNKSCINVCERCVGLVRAARGRKWPDVKQVDGYEIIRDVTEDYQNIWEIIRVQTGRAENITKEIQKAKKQIVEWKEKQPSREEADILKRLNVKLQSYTARSIIDKSMEKAYEINRIQPNVICRIQLLSLLQLCYDIFQKKISNHYKLVCIDESQDISVVEINLLKKLLGENVYWNLYGDYMQVSTAYKGQPQEMKLWEQMKTQINADLYTMDVNYRNSKEIVEHCNDEFNINATAMGLNGEVFCDCWSGCWNAFMDTLQECEEEYTAAIIVDSPEKFEMYRNELLYGGYGIDESDLSIGAVEGDKLALLDVKSAKGMEFRYVFVDEEEMTQSERYIACTRALEKLFVTEGDE